MMNVLGLFTPISIFIDFLKRLQQFIHILSVVIALDAYPDQFVVIPPH